MDALWHQEADPISGWIECLSDCLTAFYKYTATVDRELDTLERGGERMKKKRSHEGRLLLPNINGDKIYFTPFELCKNAFL